MRPWRWQIPRIHQIYIASQPDSAMSQLIDALDEVEQTLDGVPTNGTMVEWDEAIFEWRVVGYRILYERLHDHQHLYMVDIQSI